MTTEATNSDQNRMADEDALIEGAEPDVPVKEPHMPDVAVLQLPPGSVQFPTPGDFTWNGFKQDVSPLIRQLLQPKWLLVVAPLAALYIYVIIRAAGNDWYYLGSPLIIQPFVPLLTIWLIWRRRQQVMRQYYEVAFVYPEDSPKRRGNIWPLTLAILLMAVAAIIQMNQLSVIGLVIGIFGMVYYLYGAFQLRSLWQMLAFLLLMIPPPIGALARITILLQLGQTTLAAMIAKMFDSGAEVREKIILHLTTANIVITPALCGITVIVPLVVLTIWLAILRRIPVLATLALVVIGVITAVAVNTLRLIAFGLLSMENPNPWLVEVTNWVLVGICFFLVMRVATRLTTRRQVEETETTEAEENEDSLTADLDVILRGSATANESDVSRDAAAKDAR